MKQEVQFGPGNTIADRYRVLGVIGAGGAGTVYEAETCFGGRRVALKILDRPLREITRRLELEAQAITQLRHRYVVRVLDGGITPDGLVWFAMDLLQGVTLRDRIYFDGPLPVEVSLRYGIQIAEGVQAAHELEVLHRDLKPENVMVLNPEDEIRVLDFGTSRFKQTEPAAPNRLRVVGTYAYMPPERLQSNTAERRSDIYALGHILYEMLSGRHCFSEGPGPLDLPPTYELGVRQITTQPPRLTEAAPAVPDYIAEVVHRALAKDREARQSSMREVANELRAALTRYDHEQQVRKAPGQKISVPPVAAPADGLKRDEATGDFSESIEKPTVPEVPAARSQLISGFHSQHPSSFPGGLGKGEFGAGELALLERIPPLRALDEFAASLVERDDAPEASLVADSRATAEPLTFEAAAAGPSAGVPTLVAQETLPLGVPSYMDSNAGVELEEPYHPPTPLPVPPRYEWPAPVPADAGFEAKMLLGCLRFSSGTTPHSRLLDAFWKLIFHDQCRFLGTLQHVLVATISAEPWELEPIRNHLCDFADSEGQNPATGVALVEFVSRHQARSPHLFALDRDGFEHLIVAQGAAGILPANDSRKNAVQVLRALGLCSGEELSLVFFALTALADATRESEHHLALLLAALAHGSPDERLFAKTELHDRMISSGQITRIRRNPSSELPPASSQRNTDRTTGTGPRESVAPAPAKAVGDPQPQSRRRWFKPWKLLSLLPLLGVIRPLVLSNTPAIGDGSHHALSETVNAQLR